jgi:hypothetical protein
MTRKILDVLLVGILGRREAELAGFELEDVGQVRQA